jgi:hypothetical protein
VKITHIEALHQPPSRKVPCEDGLAINLTASIPASRGILQVIRDLFELSGLSGLPLWRDGYEAAPRIGAGEHPEGSAIALKFAN